MKILRKLHNPLLESAAVVTYTYARLGVGRSQRVESEIFDAKAPGENRVNRIEAGRALRHGWSAFSVGWALQTSFLADILQNVEIKRRSCGDGSSSHPLRAVLWSFRHLNMETAGINESAIPKGLSAEEIEVYQTLMLVVQQRKGEGLKPRPLVVITDVGKDYDDLAALTVLKELHRLKLVELRAVVANLMPVEKRARLAKGALDSLGLHDIPVARGTKGSLDEHEELDYEFDCEFMAPADFPQQDGQDLLRRTYETAKESEEKLHLVCLSSLQDIQLFASTHPDLVAAVTGEVYMQGGNQISNGKFTPDKGAANNHFNYQAAKEWHSFIQTNHLSSHTYTKSASFDVPLTSDLFQQLKATKHPVGKHLHHVQVEQDLAFYIRSCETDASRRFSPFMDQKWFLEHKTNWPQQFPMENKSLPVGKEVIPYLSKLVLYDVLVALGSIGSDALVALNIFREKDRKDDSKTHHWILESEGIKSVVPEKIALVISSLMKGSLLSAPQKIASNPSQS